MADEEKCRPSFSSHHPMKTVALVVVLAACLSAALARKTPCTVPQQFTTRILQAQLSGKCAVYADAGQLFYDYPGQRSRVDLSGVFGGTPMNLTVLDFYHKNTRYTIDQTTNKCTSRSLSGSLDTPDIPSTAAHVGTYLIGAQDIDAWLILEPTNHLDIVVSTTGGSCFLTSLVAVNTSSSEVMITESFFNFLPDLPPFIFDVPSECVHTKLVRDVQLEEAGEIAATTLSGLKGKFWRG